MACQCIEYRSDSQRVEKCTIARKAKTKADSKGILNCLKTKIKDW